MADTFYRTYEAGRPLPFLTPHPGESAQSLHQRRIAAANQQNNQQIVQQQSLASQYQKMEKEAKRANVAREKEIRNIYSNILNQISGSESSLRAAGLADIERQAGQLVGQETQQMISSGLYGTTTAAAIPRNVATSFTRPSRLKLEDLLASRKREAQLGLAGFVERIETPYPDYNALMQAQIAAMQV